MLRVTPAGARPAGQLVARIIAGRSADTTSANDTGAGHPIGTDVQLLSPLLGLAAPANILLVDDRPENLVAIVAVLVGLVHNLVLATSGQEALKRLLEESFALVLLY